MMKEALLTGWCGHTLQAEPFLTVHMRVIKDKAKRDKRGSARRVVCSHPCKQSLFLRYICVQ